MATKYPGVEALGEGIYRIRTSMYHPKTGRRHEIDRRIEAESSGVAAERLAKERSKWLAERTKANDAAPALRVGPALEAWLTKKRSTIADSTASTYGSAVAWWTAVLGDYLVSEIESADVQDAVSGALEGGDGSETVSGRLRVLRTFARESRRGSMVEGVMVRSDVREDERREDEGRGLTLAELRRFLGAGPMARTDRAGRVTKTWRRAWALVATLAWTGLRFGEASALEWSDVDLEAATLRVRRAQWRGKVKHPKAKASKRLVSIPDELVETLRDHRRAMLVGQLHGVDTPLVFPSRREGATYVANAYARKAVLHVCELAAIELAGRPAVHVLRHSWNNLIRQHASELVRRALVGHADSEIGERYSTVTLEERRAAVGAVVRLLREKA
jgi:integrase